MHITIKIGVLSAGLSAAAPAALTGIVLDSLDGTPLHGVSVALEGTAQRTETGSDGRFRLESGTSVRNPVPPPARLGYGAWRDARGRSPGMPGASPSFRIPFRSAPAAAKRASGAALLRLEKAGYRAKAIAALDGIETTARLVPDPAADCAGLPAGSFCEDFRAPVDTSRWWYALRHWGPPPPRNHGVIPENVSVRDGLGLFAANGDRYSGPLKGVRKSGSAYVRDQPGSRSGGVLVTDAYFGSGRYEVRMRLPPKTGVCAALWTFHYREIAEGDTAYATWLGRGNVPIGAAGGRYLAVNHEIDIETPTAALGAPDAQATWSRARFNSWIGETAPEFTSRFDDLGADKGDGKFHTYRFDWHTAESGAGPRVEFYVDGALLRTIATHVPTLKGRFWIGTWFPEWAGGAADFDVEHLAIDWIRIIPFHHAGDQSAPESYPADSLVKKQVFPIF